MKNLRYFLYCLSLLFFLSACNEGDTPLDDQEGSQENFLSYEDGLITLKSGAIVEKKGDNFYWQGDLMLSQTQLEALDEFGDIIVEDPSEAASQTRNIHPVYNIPVKAGEDNVAVPRAFGINPTPFNMWAMVRFVYSPTLTFDRRNIIRQALQHWEANTNVRFYNATGQPTVDPVYGFAYPYLEFVNSTVNSSFVGRIGGRQAVNIAAFQTVAVAIHEIGHAIGLLHEQSRFDRDSFINLNLSNVPSDNRHNFNKRTTNYYAVGPLDYNSVMMYGSFDFAINPSIPVMTRKDGTTWTGGNVLSGGDRSWANSIYIPYIARSDIYAELAPVVFKPDNTIMSASERLQLQAQLNNGNPNPPNCCRLPNNF
ncbi:hypothetical protein FNH22_13275 [Fulvivirga sp. M361]|uniref:M12 family metallopeptidase n=1 Tax=Fulvivirga sp. M361 TaxID=2594266 RepID=UPI001179E461|nr:M12 family metallopeptidase [Fulvivirga sp. M361]TRX58840.1 hypothetical protein FNH22_13275 [Fulvivirga sp. M361]